MADSVAVYQPRYYPRLHYLARANSVDTFVLYDDVEFSRQSPQHRARIEFGGRTWLTVPVKHTGNETLIQDAKIDMDHQWRRTHRNTLMAKYGGAAAEAFGPFYERLEQDANLVDLTIPTLGELFDRFEVDAEIVRSSELSFERSDDASENLARLVSHLGGDHYISGGTGYEQYLDESVFSQRGIDVSVQDWTPKWKDGNVCALDVLFGAETPARYV